MTTGPHIDHLGPVPSGKGDAGRIPAHWLFARLGKRVLRPGGMAASVQMLRALTIQPSDDVVEFAPGLGMTARLALAALPASYTGVERDRQAARLARGVLPSSVRVIVRPAADTGLETGGASVVFGEALLSLQTPAAKASILAEAHRLLGEGGRLGIHELALVPDDLSEPVKQQVQRELAAVLHVGARPCTALDWCRLLESAGFEIHTKHTGALRVLEAKCVLADEGVTGVLRLAWNLSRDWEARARVAQIRRTLRRHRAHLASIVIVARKATIA